MRNDSSQSDGEGREDEGGVSGSPVDLRALYDAANARAARLNAQVKAPDAAMIAASIRGELSEPDRQLVRLAMLHHPDVFDAVLAAEHAMKGTKVLHFPVARAVDVPRDSRIFAGLAMAASDTRLLYTSEEVMAGDFTVRFRLVGSDRTVEALIRTRESGELVPDATLLLGVRTEGGKARWLLVVDADDGIAQLGEHASLPTLELGDLVLLVHRRPGDE